MPGRGQYWKKGGLVDETVKEEDLSLALQSKVNAVGAGHEILDEGSSLPARGRLDFKGAGVVASDGIEDTTVITIAGGAGGGIPESGFPLEEWFIDHFTYGNLGITPWEDRWDTLVSSIQVDTADGIGMFFTLPSTGIGARTQIRSKWRFTWATDLGQGSGDWQLEMRVATGKVTSGQINQAYRFGILENGVAEPAGTFPYGTVTGKRCWFTVNANPTDSTFNVEMDDGTTNQVANTTFGTQGNYVCLKIVYDSTANNVTFFAGGGGFGAYTQVAQFTSSIPTGSFNIYLGSQNGSGGNKGFGIDGIYMKKAIG